MLGKSDTRLLPYVQCGADGPTPFFASSVLVFGEVFPDRSVPGGAPFNVACHLAAFGEKFFLISRTGQDPLRFLGTLL